MKKYRIRLIDPVWGVPVTFIEHYAPQRERERESNAFNLIGHEHDLGNGENLGQFEVNGNGVYKRILFHRI